MDRAEVTIKLK